MWGRGIPQLDSVNGGTGAEGGLGRVFTRGGGGGTRGGGGDRVDLAAPSAPGKTSVGRGWGRLLPGSPWAEEGDLLDRSGKGHGGERPDELAGAAVFIDLDPFAGVDPARGGKGQSGLALGPFPAPDIL